MLASLPPGFAARRDVRSRLVRAAKIFPALDHPALVRVIEVRADGPAQGVVTEVAPGLPLLQALPGAVPIGVALGVLGQVAEGLHMLHAAGVVHGAVTPERVLCAPRPDGTWQVKLDDIALTWLTAPGVIGAAEPFPLVDWCTAPEVLRGARPGPAADVYALGSMTQALCTGVPVTLASEQASARAAALRATGMPGPLVELVAALTDPRPQGRPDAATTVDWMRDVATEVGHLGPFPPAGRTGAALAAMTPPGAPRGVVVPADIAPTGVAPIDGASGAEPGAEIDPPPAPLPVPAPRTHRAVRLGPVLGTLVAAAVLAPLVTIVLGRAPSTETALGPTSWPSTPAATPSQVVGAPSPSRSAASVIDFGRPTGGATKGPVTATGPTAIGPTATGPTATGPAPSRSSTLSTGSRTPPPPTPTPTASPTPSGPAPTVSSLSATDTGRGRVRLVAEGVSARAGTIASVTFSDGSTQDAAAPSGDGSYRTTLRDLVVGRSYDFSVQVCNSIGRCTSTSIQHTVGG